MDANTPATQSFPGGNPINDGPTVDKVSRPARPKGPNAGAVVLGLVAVLFAGLIIAAETLTWRVDWSGLGPGAIVVVGVLLVVVGAIGLARRHDDV